MAHTDLAAANKALAAARGREEQLTCFVESEIARLGEELVRIEAERGAYMTMRATMRTLTPGNR